MFFPLHHISARFLSLFQGQQKVAELAFSQLSNIPLIIPQCLVLNIKMMFFKFYSINKSLSEKNYIKIWQICTRCYMFKIHSTFGFCTFYSLKMGFVTSRYIFIWGQSPSLTKVWLTGDKIFNKWHFQLIIIPCNLS